jgi:hypothetical protein
MDDLPFTLGRLELEDDRDDAFPFSLAGNLQAKKGSHRVFWRPGPVLNQGQFPHCVAFAWKQYLQCAPLRQGLKLQPDYIYELCQQNDRWPGENYAGTSVRAGAKVLNRLGFVDKYLWSRSAAEVRDWLFNHGPVVLGTRWYRDMFTPDSKGMVSIGGGAVGGHAYLCIGYSRKRNAFRCINSWGNKWGNQGRFWISFEDLDKLVRKGEACAATERRV